MAYLPDGTWVADTLPGIERIGLPSTGSFNPMEGANVPAPSWGSPSTAGQLQTISGYRPWGSGLPSNAGFGSKLGGWLSGNGAMIGGIANLASQGLGAYLGLQQLSMAKDALRFDKKVTKANFANAADTYRTAKTDQLTGRYFATEEERQQAIKDAELSYQNLKG